jgi:hypothetical protein
METVTLPRPGEPGAGDAPAKFKEAIRIEVGGVLVVLGDSAPAREALEVAEDAVDSLSERRKAVHVPAPELLGTDLLREVTGGTACAAVAYDCKGRVADRLLIGQARDRIAVEMAFSKAEQQGGGGA